MVTVRQAVLRCIELASSRALTSLPRARARADHSPEDNLFHHLQLSQAELEAYRTRYGGTWWRLARESTDATRGWRRARRVEWERLRDRRGELVRTRRPSHPVMGLTD